MGFVIIATAYILAIVIILMRIQKTGRPLFNNLFVKFVLPLFHIEITQKPNIDGLRREKNLVKENIENEQKMMKVQTQLLKYTIFKDFLNVFAGLFKSNNKRKKKNEKIDKKESES